MLDLLIIGSGGAGLSAAIEAKRNKLKILVVSKTYPTSSQTSQAQGGINGVLDEKNDKIQNHINDTLKSAHNIGDKKTIEFMCENAKDTISWLDNLGVAFSKKDDNTINQRSLGGASNPRACYSSDYTGLKILHTLYDQCLKEDVEFLNEYILLDLITHDNSVYGAVFLNIKDSSVQKIYAKNTLIASGGYTGIFTNHTTNSTASTGDAAAIGFLNGVILANMEYIQFHPTALKGSNILLSESARGEGGYLVTSDDKRFVDELKPRDIVAREIYKKINKGEDVFLDLRHLGKEKIIKSMPQEYELALNFANTKLDEQKVQIVPSAHYSMGGIKTDINGKTNLKNLYAVGESSCNGVHGANRLGGNSLLEIITFGRKTSKYISENLSKENIELNKKPNQFIVDSNYIEKLFENKTNCDFYKIKNSLGEYLYKNCGIFKDEIKLQTALDQINIWENEIKDYGLKDKNKTYNTELKEFLELKNMLTVSKLMIISSLERKESRGAHFRSDYKEENINYQKETLIVNKNNEIHIIKDI